MSNPLIRLCDHYVVLEPGKPERFLNAQDTLSWLEEWLESLDNLPEDLIDQSSISSAAQKLLDTACDLKIGEGLILQWYAVRLDH